MQDNISSELEDILNSADSPQKYQPEGFNISEEYEKARSLRCALTGISEADIEVEDPSLFQDGSILTRLLVNKESGGSGGQIVLSSFGHLATICDINDECVVSALHFILGENGYTYVSYDLLNYPYSGSYKKFSKLTWRDRFFSSFYDPLDFRI